MPPGEQPQPGRMVNLESGWSKLRAPSTTHSPPQQSSYRGDRRVQQMPEHSEESESIELHDQGVGQVQAHGQRDPGGNRDRPGQPGGPSHQAQAG